jgi:hypothetical protein
VGNDAFSPVRNVGVRSGSEKGGGSGGRGRAGLKGVGNEDGGMGDVIGLGAEEEVAEDASVDLIVLRCGLGD